MLPLSPSAALGILYPSAHLDGSHTLLTQTLFTGGSTSLIKILLLGCNVFWIWGPPWHSVITRALLYDSPQTHNLVYPWEKPHTNPDWETCFGLPGHYSRLSRSWRQPKTEKLSQTREVWGAMTAKCNEVPWKGSWNSKRTFTGKLVTPPKGGV